MEERKIPDQPRVTPVISKDGSTTLWAPDFDEHYHSLHGAVTESLHVFIESGLKPALERTEGAIHIFEMGFGTGLNALLTYFHRGDREIYYKGIEKYPLMKEAYQALNFGEQMEEDQAQELLMAMHEVDWNAWVELKEGFQLHKVRGDLLDFEAESAFDLIYFDAFAPTSQGHLWTQEVMDKLYKFCRPGAVMTTYSAKGDVRRAMQAAGFEVEKIQGPPGKREMLRAFRN